MKTKITLYAAGFEARRQRSRFRTFRLLDRVLLRQARFIGKAEFDPGLFRDDALHSAVHFESLAPSQPGGSGDFEPRLPGPFVTTERVRPAEECRPRDLRIAQKRRQRQRRHHRQ